MSEISLRQSNAGCPICTKDYMRKKMSVTHAEFISRLEANNDDYRNGVLEITGKYVNMHTKIGCKCKICGNTWESLPQRLCEGDGKCRVCRGGGGRLTHEEFIHKLSMNNSAFAHKKFHVISQYNGSGKEIKCKCCVCGKEWTTTPAVLMQGCWCRHCNHSHIGKLKSNSDFLKDLELSNSHFKNGEIKVVGNYNGSTSKLKCICNNGHEFYSTPPNLLRGSGCPKCIRRHCTTKEYIDTVASNNAYYQRGQFEIIGEYKSRKDRILCKCNICGNEWRPQAGYLLSSGHNKTGQGCPECNGHHHMNNDEFLCKLRDNNEKFRNGELFVLSQYSGWHGKLSCKCALDGYEWSTTAAVLLRGGGCPKCANTLTYDKDTFLEKLKEKNFFYRSGHISIVGDYINNSTKIECLCNETMQTFYLEPNKLMNGRGCPICATSNGEQRITRYLVENSIGFIREKAFDDMLGCRGGNLRFDFFIPKLNIAIEFNGEQHYRSVDYFGGDEHFRILQANDKLKRQYAEKNNIHMIDIGYFDYENIETILNKEIANIRAA